MRDFLAQRKAKGASPAPQPEPAKAKADPAKAETITAACGHQLHVRHLRSTPCPSCVRANAKRRHAEKQDRQAEQKAWRRGDAGRLPDGARFEVEYDAVARMWAGRLVIGEQVYGDMASGVFTLLRQLDAKYRAAQGGAPPGGS